MKLQQNQNSFVKFNVNTEARVKLTEAGKSIYQKHYNKLRPHEVEIELKLDKEGYFVDQLWNIMNIFGEHIYLGASNLPFIENNIEILKEN